MTSANATVRGFRSGSATRPSISRIDGGVRPGPDRPDLGDLDHHVTWVIRGGTPTIRQCRSPTVSFRNPPAPEQRFACFGVPLEEQQLLGTWRRTCGPGAHRASQVLHGRIDQPDVRASAPCRPRRRFR